MSKYESNNSRSASDSDSNNTCTCELKHYTRCDRLIEPPIDFHKTTICLLSARRYIYLFLMCIVNMLCTSKLFTFKYIHVTIKSLSLFIREGIQ